MDDRVIHFRLGLFVVIVCTAMMAVFLVYLFGEVPSMGRRTIYVRFADVTGVTEETPVRKNGILVGRVRNMTPTESGVVVSLAIDSKWKLFENELCRIGTDNLFGDAVLEFVSTGDLGASSREIQDGEYMKGVVASDPLDAMRVVVDMKEEFHSALLAIRSAGEEVGSMAESMNMLVADNQRQVNQVLGRADKAFGRFDTAMVSINQVVGNEDLQLALEEALEGVPTLVSNAGSLLQNINNVTNEAEINLKNLRGLTEPLGEQGGSIISKLSKSADRLDSMMIEFQEFGQRLNSGQGTVGQLVHNPELYNNLNRAAENIEKLSRELRPIMNDARVVVDKVARNPRMLGVQGALHRRTSGIK